MSIDEHELGSETDFKTFLSQTLNTVEEDYKKENFLESKSTNGFYMGLFDRPAKRPKNAKNERRFEFSELDLEESEKINNVVLEFTNAARKIRDTEPVLYEIFYLLVHCPKSWLRISFIFSILKKLIGQNQMPSQLIVEPEPDGYLSQATVQQEPQVTLPQLLRFFPNLLNINFPPLWMGAACFLLIILRDHEREFVLVKPDLTVPLIRQVLKMVNTLPKEITDIQFECIDKGQELIDALLIGRVSSGVNIVSHYQVLKELPSIYGTPVNGRFEYVHWTMEQFVNDLCKRRKNLASLMMPPDASWPLISHYSRSHEHTHLAKLSNNQIFHWDYEQLIKAGQATDYASHFCDMFFQRASVEEVKLMIKALKSKQEGLEPIRSAIITGVRDVVAVSQKRSNFEPRKNYTMKSHDEMEMEIPENLDFWELIIGLADQLYHLVAGDSLKYEEILTDFIKLVNTDENNRPVMEKDNTLIWLLLQLWHIEKIGLHVITPDFTSDERLFSMLVLLYNENQVMSKDAFYLRDLSLPCALILQQSALQDKSSLKYRHPKLSPVLIYTPVCHHLLTYFPKAYRENVANLDLFRNLTLQEIIKVATVSQTQKLTVADTLYVYLVPNKSFEVGKLAFPQAKFLKGGNVGYKLLDFLNINGKHRLASLIYKMMLDGDSGPRFNLDEDSVDATKQLTCVSPYILDVVYKIVYGAPWSLELMIQEIFDKLKKVDKQYKKDSEPTSSDHNMRWQHTILEILNYRLLRFLKILPRAPDFLNFIKYSLSHLEHRQMYRGVEMFAIHSMVLNYFLL